jgi:hypothetical protein
MANGIGQRNPTVGSFDGLTGYVYVYVRADGRIVRRCHPNAPPSTPERSHQESDSTELEEQAGGRGKEEQIKENKSVFALRVNSPICSNKS